MLSQKKLWNNHFKYKHQIFEKYQFWTHVNVGSCSMVDWEDLEKIQNFPPCRLQDIRVLSDKNPFFAPVKNRAKNRAAAFHKVTFVWKNVQNGGASLDSFFKIHSSRQSSYMLENFQIIWNCSIYRKKIISRKM